MEYMYEENIKCPYCGWEEEDSWEFSEDEGKCQCGNCEEEFYYTRNVEVTYSSSKIDCSEKNLNHDFVFDRLYAKRKNYVEGKWHELDPIDYRYFKIFICSICNKNEFEEITKEEYNDIKSQTNS